MKRLSAAGVVALLAVAVCPSWVGATNHDFQIQQFFLPGQNRAGFRIHAAVTRNHMNVSIPYGSIWAEGGYKTLVRYTHFATASLTDRELGLGTTAVNYQRFGYQGSVIGITVGASEALTAGRITVEATVRRGGTLIPTGLTAVIDGATGPTQFGMRTQGRGLDFFFAADEVGCRLTTTADVAPTRAQVICTVVVEF